MLTVMIEGSSLVRRDAVYSAGQAMYVHTFSCRDDGGCLSL